MIFEAAVCLFWRQFVEFPSVHKDIILGVCICDEHQVIIYLQSMMPTKPILIYFESKKGPITLHPPVVNTHFW